MPAGDVRSRGGFAAGFSPSFHGNGRRAYKCCLEGSAGILICHLYQFVILIRAKKTDYVALARMDWGIGIVSERRDFNHVRETKRY
jgi:hypothetical protein